MIHLNRYLQEIETIRETGQATEHSYRSALEVLLKANADNITTSNHTSPVQILHEPRLLQGSAPDFRVTGAGGAIIGYSECKRPGTNLTHLLKQDQLKRYNNLSPNILITDYYRWILLRDGKSIADVALTPNPDGQTTQTFTHMLRLFLTAEPEHITSAQRLAEALAERCKLLRDELARELPNDKTSGQLYGLFQGFRSHIYHDMSDDQFADALAQTTVYSLLLARLQPASNRGVSRGGSEDPRISLFTAEQHIPETFSLIRELSRFLSELDRQSYRGLQWILDDTLAIVNSLDIGAVIQSMSVVHTTGTTEHDDPFLYFYESFLVAYDANLRQARGVYYTPLPVVRFIVSSAHQLLKTHFQMPDGLADSRVTALDFASGTGTFIIEMMRLALNGKSPVAQRLLIKDHLLKHFYGFEYLIAPYAISHLKLSQFLASIGHTIDGQHSR